MTRGIADTPSGLPRDVGDRDAMFDLARIQMSLRWCRASVWVVLALTASLGLSQTPAPHVGTGQLDLKGVDFSRLGSVPLSGQWLFAPGTLDVAKPATQAITVPAPWDAEVNAAVKQPAQGMGVYHLTIDLGKNPGNLALSMPDNAGAYIVYLDGKKIFQNGTPGNAATERSKMVPQVVTLPPGIHSKHRLAIAVSNHVHAVGGLAVTPEIGRASVLLLQEQRAGSLAWLIFGAALAIFLHYAVMFAISKDWGYGLYSLLSLILGFYLQVTQSYHYSVFPAIDEVSRLKLEYVLLLAIPLAIYGFMRRLYPHEIPKVPLWVALAFSGAGAAYVIATHPTVFTQHRSLVSLYVLVVMLMVLGGVVWAAARKRDGAVLVVVSFLLTFLAASHDVWMSVGNLEGSMLTGWAFLVYTVGNAGALGAVASRTQQEIKNLSNDLARLNASLEERIQKRTQELADSERRLRDVSEAVGEFIWETDRRGVFTHASDRVRDLLGFRPEELYGRSIFSLLTADVREDAAVLMDPENGSDGFRGAELEVLSKGGERISLEVSAVPICANGSTTIVGWRGAAMDISDRKRTEQQLHELARTDSLTGLSNRRHFMERAGELVSMCRRQGWSAAMVLIDVDRFKSVNDTYGHEAGDQVLKLVAKVIQGATREVDVLSRYGGEEFALFLPNTDMETAILVSERARVALEDAVMEWEGTTLRVTASLGIAWANSEDLELRDLTIQSDKALYAAKASGRNRVLVYGPEMDSEAA